MTNKINGKRKVGRLVGRRASKSVSPLVRECLALLGICHPYSVPVSTMHLELGNWGVDTSLPTLVRTLDALAARGAIVKAEDSPDPLLVRYKAKNRAGARQATGRGVDTPARRSAVCRPLPTFCRRATIRVVLPAFVGSGEPIRWLDFGAPSVPGKAREAGIAVPLVPGSPVLLTIDGVPCDFRNVPTSIAGPTRTVVINAIMSEEQLRGIGLMSHVSNRTQEPLPAVIFVSIMADEGCSVTVDGRLVLRAAPGGERVLCL